MAVAVQHFHVKHGMKFSDLCRMADGQGDRPTPEQIAVLNTLSRARTTPGDPFDLWRDGAERALARVALVDPDIRGELVSAIAKPGSKAAEVEPYRRVIRNLVTVASLSLPCFGVTIEPEQATLTALPAVTAMLDHKQPVVKADGLKLFEQEPRLVANDEGFSRLVRFCCETLVDELHHDAKKLARKQGDTKFRAALMTVLESSPPNSRSFERVTSLIKELDDSIILAQALSLEGLNFDRRKL
jgi:hypothetical protein